MTLPISPSTMITSGLVGGATRLAGKVAGELGDAIGFDRVLRGESAEPAIDPLQLTSDLIATVRNHLKRLGIDPNQLSEVSVSKEGQLKVDQPHPRAAEIEAVLNADEELVALAGQLHQAGGHGPIRLQS